jgi:hypothetical protein
MAERAIEVLAVGHGGPTKAGPQNVWVPWLRTSRASAGVFPVGLELGTEGCGVDFA